MTERTEKVRELVCVRPADEAKRQIDTQTDRLIYR